MNWDQTSAYKEGYAESQQGEGGNNHNNNCLPTSVDNAAMAMGYPESEPQAITNATYGPRYLGGEDYSVMVDWVHGHIPGLEVSVEGGDVVAIADKFGPMGWPMVFFGHSTAAADFVTYETGIYHCSNLLRHSDNWTVLLNVERGEEVGYTDANLRAIYGGSLLVFHKPVTTFVHPPPPAPTDPPQPPPPFYEDDMSQTLSLKHSGGSRHWVWIAKNGSLWHGSWAAGAAEPNHLPLGSGSAETLLDFFEDETEEASGRLRLLVLGTDANPPASGVVWYDKEVNVDDVHAPWIKR